MRIRFRGARRRDWMAALPSTVPSASVPVTIMRFGLRTLWNVQPAFDGRPRQATIEPRRDVDEVVERYEFSRAVEADQVAHPAEHRDIGDGVLVIHDPLPSVETGLDDAQEALRFIDVPFERTFVGDLLAGEFMEEADLAEHWPDATHLEMQPLKGLVA